MTAPPSSAFRIRPVVSLDWAVIAELHAASWRSAYRGILSEAYLRDGIEPDRRSVWKRRLSGPLAPDLVAVVCEPEPKGGLLGFCCILPGQHPLWGSLVDNLHVRPGHTRRGLGRALLREAAFRIPERHAAAPVHVTVFERNDRANAAYERWGGELAERLTSREPDGRDHPVRRYRWPSPAELIRRLDSLP